MDKIHDFLIDIGVPASNKGFDYIHDSIKLLEEDNSHKNSICNLYNVIANSYGVTSASVDRCIRSAIRNCFKRAGTDNLSVIFGDKNVTSGKMRNSEFLVLSALYLSES